jgi:sugar transferase (PEP-CTERM/EpsH1 system associated)
MKILYVCHRFPYPPQRGGKIRPFNVIKHLSKEHVVTVASPVRSKKEADVGVGLRDYCSSYVMNIITKPMAAVNMLKNLATNQPSSMGYFYSRRLSKRILERIDETEFDLIFVHCSSVAQYVEEVNGIPKILDFGDMDSQKWAIYGKVRRFPLNIVYSIEGKRLQQEEAELARKFDYCTCTTLEEMRTLESYNVGARRAWFPNGVDAEYFKPSNEPYEKDTICFIGRMDYYPNQECMLDFCTNTLPLIKEKRPHLRMFIIGANPSAAITKLGRIPGVVVTGSVDDVRPQVWKCAVNVAPLNIARGTQNKILESLAMGVPTVASTQAATGIDAVPGEHFLTASSHREYAESVLKLLSNSKERQRYSEAGRARMLSHHSWEGSMKKLDEIIRDCLAAYGQRNNLNKSYSSK